MKPRLENLPITLLRAAAAGAAETSPVLACIHPVMGRAEVYRPLAALLAWPGPIVGIDAPDPEPFTIAGLAARYADELAPRVPVALLGWALGGVIAAELAIVLASRACEIRTLALVDSRAPVPEMRARPTDRETLAKFFAYQRSITDAEPLDDVALEHRLQTFMALTRAVFHHDQRAVPVPIHLFEARDAHPKHPKPPTLGWDELAPRVEHHEIAGTHFTVLEPSRAHELARTLDRYL